MSAATSGIVIAGGQSRRLGQDKRKLRLWGEDQPTLLEYTISVLSPLCAEVIVVLNDPENWQHLPARLVTDQMPDTGVLGGLYSGLSSANHPYALVVGVDMPFLNADLLRAMLAIPRDYDALVPRSINPTKTRNRLNAETLHAVYSRQYLDLLHDKLIQGTRSIADFLDAINVTFLESNVVRRYDPDGYAFLNINTPDDLAEILRIIHTSSSDKQ